MCRTRNLKTMLVRKMNEREKERTYVCVCAFSCVRLRAYLCVFVQLFGHMRVACMKRERERKIGEKERKEGSQGSDFQCACV